jgi:hypothetical protein
MSELLIRLENLEVPYCPSCKYPTKMQPYTIGCFKCPACECIDDIG